MKNEYRPQRQTTMCNLESKKKIKILKTLHRQHSTPADKKANSDYTDSFVTASVTGYFITSLCPTYDSSQLCSWSIPQTVANSTEKSSLWKTYKKKKSSPSLSSSTPPPLTLLDYLGTCRSSLDFLVLTVNLEGGNVNGGSKPQENPDPWSLILNPQSPHHQPV